MSKFPMISIQVFGVKAIMSQSSLIILLFSAVFAFSAIGNANGRVVYKSTEEGNKEEIVGGYTTSISKHPYQVLLTNGDYICGGTILTETHILTAAHCVSESRGNYIVAGTSKVVYDRGIKVKQIWLHPQWNNQSIANDIAVLKLAKPIVFNELRQPAKLPTRNVANDEAANVTGFGALHNSLRMPSPRLQAVEVNVWNHDYCKILLGNKVSDYQICVLSDAGTGACVGDSGGPLAVGNTVVGVVSFGIGRCANGLPQIYSNVYKYLPFIKDVIRRSSD